MYEVQRRVFDLNVPEYSYELVKRAISMSLDKTDYERELVSRMLYIGHSYKNNILSTNMVGKGFERLFEIISELEKDCLNASDLVATFLARCVVDEVLPPSFLTDDIVVSLGGAVIEHAKRMLSREHSSARLERVWGAGDGRPVSELKQAVDVVFQEYLLSRDMAEATRCIQELCPTGSYFYHEIVKRGITNSLDKTTEDQQCMSNLIAHLVLEKNACSSEQCMQGFSIVIDSVSDLALDNPAAAEVVKGFVQRAIDDSILPPNFEVKV